eukprot:135716_1
MFESVVSFSSFSLYHYDNLYSMACIILYLPCGDCLYIIHNHETCSIQIIIKTREPVMFITTNIQNIILYYLLMFVAICYFICYCLLPLLLFVVICCTVCYLMFVVAVCCCSLLFVTVCYSVCC